MRIAIKVRTHYPKNHRRAPTCTAIAHLPDRTKRDEPRLEIYVTPRPGYDADQVASSLFPIRPFEIDVADDFFTGDKAFARDIILMAVRREAGLRRLDRMLVQR